MKPGIEEQLQGTCRILENVVAPHVGDPFARTILDNLVANLRMLTGALPSVPGFLRADNEATARLLADLRTDLPGELAARVGQAFAEPEPDSADAVALEARNTALRALLAEAVRLPTLNTQQHRAIVRHMTERAARVPMRYVPTAPTPPKHAA